MENSIFVIGGFAFGAKPLEPLLTILTAMGYQITVIDLPAVGVSVDDFVTNNPLPSASSIIGWSLGGQLALRLAHKYSCKLFMLCANLQFVRSVDWSCAMDSAVFMQFCHQFDKDPVLTLHKFAYLSCMGQKNAKFYLNQLKKNIAPLLSAKEIAQHRYHLQLLASISNQYYINSFTSKIYCFLAKNDSLVPYSLTKQLMLPNQQVYLFENAGHLLPWSQKTKLAKLINKLITES